MHKHPLCGHFVELSLWSGESLAWSGCSCWKSNWTKFDHLGSIWGHWETVSGSFLIPFGSGLEVPSQYASNFSFSSSYRRTIYEGDSMIPVIPWTLIIQSLRWYLHLRWCCWQLRRWMEVKFATFTNHTGSKVCKKIGAISQYEKWLRHGIK